MFERAPFKNCPLCQETGSFGLLSVGSNALTRRCTKCRHSEAEPLPELNKKVVYLDQLAFSEIFKVRSGTRNPSAPSGELWERINIAVKRAVLLHQIVCPTSDIHSQETTVFNRSLELRQACEMIGGDASFKDTSYVNGMQLAAFAEAFQETRSIPSIAFNVDDVLEGDRNVWLPDLHITTNMDFSVFADGIRRSRESGSDELTALARRWIAEKPSFEQQLDNELKGWGETLSQIYVDLNEELTQAILAGDVEKTSSNALHPVNILMRQLMAAFRVDRVEVHADDRQQFVEFLRWDGLEHIPHHRIGAYLYAALARRYANGQKRLPSRGTLNDFEAISTYGPYVDAMFLDRECATLLKEDPLKSDLPITGRIFSTASGEDFIEYLDSLSASATKEVRALAKSIYGVN
ncbi:MAG: hypothetical protein U9P68_06965 [Pseudomonadota bacterium]|nr:hypothetical protein [Pseudomonadota bacterium]